jgi:hypothetical protein
MKKNMGNADRIIRLIIAAVFITLYFTGAVAGIPGVVIVAFAVIFLLTSLVGLCPLYMPFGLSTLKKNKENSI